MQVFVQYCRCFITLELYFDEMDHIEITPYDPTWPEKFLAERQRLQSCLTKFPILEIAHFGSTAIPNMPAKPVIDIIIAVPSVSEAKNSFPAALDKIGYDFWRNNPKNDRLFFAKGVPPRGMKRTHHIHVCERPSLMWEQLAFADYLQKHPTDAKEYAALKTRLSKAHRHDREAYTDGKNQFVTMITDRALKQ